MAKTFSERLRSGSKLLGSWCTFSSYCSVEVMTELGLDFLILDLQHSEVTQSDFPAAFGAFRGTTVTPVVRAPENDYHIINWLFDQGVGAVMVPLVNTVEAARRAVKAAKFPPLGKRSFGPYRAARYSFGAQEYMADADQRATLIIQIESADAIRNLDEILAIDGVDAIFVGPNDVAFSMLNPGQSLVKPAGEASEGDGASSWTAFARSPELMELCGEALRKASATGIPYGMTGGTRKEVDEWYAKGAAYMTLGSDFLFMRAGAAKILAKPDGGN